MIDLKRYQQELAQLVATPSMSCVTSSLDQTNLGVIELLASWLEKLGFASTVQKLVDPRGKANLIAKLGSGEGGLVLAGHTDTVPCDTHSWEQDPFKLTEKNNRLYGLGATDMKGFFPVVLAAARDFSVRQLKAPLYVVATADEETSMAGVRALTHEGLQARAALIGEPTSLRPIRMHKGIMMESVTIRGKSGHSSDPSLGNSALEAMHEVMSELLSYRADLQARYQNAGFAVRQPTLNLGCIHGGDNPNRICGDCELHFDVRSLPGMDHAQMKADIGARLSRVAQKRSIDIQLRTLFEDVPAFEQPSDSELVSLCERYSGHASVSADFCTEAPYLQKLDMQTVVLGPGSIDQAHQPNEYIPLEQVGPAVTLVQQLIRHYCC